MLLKYLWHRHAKIINWIRTTRIKSGRSSLMSLLYVYLLIGMLYFLKYTILKYSLALFTNSAGVITKMSKSLKPFLSRVICSLLPHFIEFLFNVKVIWQWATCHSQNFS